MEEKKCGNHKDAIKMVIFNMYQWFDIIVIVL